MNADSIETIRKIAEPLVREEGLFLVDVEIKHQNVPELWVLVDAEENRAMLEACANISRMLGQILEDEDVLQGTYRLNVSSPGLARPLSDRRQYAKNKGRLAKVKYQINSEYFTINGSLAEVNEDGIVIETEKEGVKNVQFDTIVETKIIPTI